MLLLILSLEPLVWGRAQTACGDISGTPSAPQRDPPYLLLLQRHTTNVHTSRTDYILDNLDDIESLPFVGMVVNIPASWTLMGGSPVTYEEFYDGWLAPLQGNFTRLTQNFVEVMIDDPGDVFDDTAWNVTIDNWWMMARATCATGFVAIFFDN